MLMASICQMLYLRSLKEGLIISTIDEETEVLEVVSCPKLK